MEIICGNGVENRSGKSHEHKPKEPFVIAKTPYKAHKNEKDKKDLLVKGEILKYKMMGMTKYMIHFEKCLIVKAFAESVKAIHLTRNQKTNIYPCSEKI
jgi:hypothetical protein